MSSDLANANLEGTALAPEEAKALASEIIALTDGGEDFDARAILRSRPELAEHLSVVVDLAYEEFCRRLDAGKPPAPGEFVRRFPEVAESLLELLEVHEYLDEHPDEFVQGSSPAWPEPGDEVSGFHIVHEIGRGGFSRVYLAREKHLGEREVVIKICRQANDEAARLGKLDHPHIVPVYSVQPHPHPGFSIICMPYLGSATLGDILAEDFAAPHARGRPATNRSRLAQRLRRFFCAGKLSAHGADILAAIKRANQRHGLPRMGRLADPSQVHWTLRRGSYTEAIVESGAEICEALAYAHAAGICHCDVKPSNVLLTAGGRSLLLDFNLSMQRGVVDAVVGGTLPYMAPEQLRLVLATDTKCVAEIDRRTDLFALGVTMFQLLTGRHPFQTEEFTQGGNQQAAGRLLERQRKAKNLKGELERVLSPRAADVVAQCLAFNPNDRPESADQVARRLRQELRPIPRVRRWGRVHPVKAGLMAALVGMVLVTVVSFGIYLATRPPANIRYFKSGIARLENGDYTGARDDFHRAEAACGDEETDCSSRARLLRGWADYWAAQGETPNESVRSRLLKPADADPAHVLWYELGIAHMDAGNWEQAVGCFDQTLGLSPDSVEAQVLRGWAYLKAAQREDIASVKRNGYLQEAFRDFSEGHSTGNAESAASLAWYHVQQDAPEKRRNLDATARITFQHAVDRGFVTRAVLNNYGCCLIGTREWPKAVEQLESAAPSEPVLPAVHHNLAVAKLMLARNEISYRKIPGPDETNAAKYESETSKLVESTMKRILVRFRTVSCTFRAWSFIESAKEHIRIAKEHGEASAELELDAARIWLFASVLFKSNSIAAGEPQDWLDEALDRCEVAIKEFGLSQKELETLLICDGKLAENPRFQQLWEASSTSMKAIPTARIVDIYPDIRKRLNSLPRD
jgi:serine/threonine protein kinase/Tfp pilus assembly protein PilF